MNFTPELMNELTLCWCNRPLESIAKNKNNNKGKHARNKGNQTFWVLANKCKPSVIFPKFGKMDDHTYYLA